MKYQREYHHLRNLRNAIHKAENDLFSTHIITQFSEFLIIFWFRAVVEKVFDISEEHSNSIFKVEVINTWEQFT